MQIIAIVNEKGGTGKTTTAVNLSAALGELKRNVLLVDLDGQAASSRWLGVEGDMSFADALWRGEGLQPIPDVIPGVSLAPGSGKLDSVAHDLRPTQGGQLRKLLSQLTNFEYVIIDCPPSLGNRLIGNALLAATHAIVPVETSILALDGLKILLTTIEDVREGFDHDIILAGVLACRFDARTRLSRYILAELKRALPGKVFQTVIRENVRMRECPASGQSILTYAPLSHAAEDYRSLARELLDFQTGPARLDAGAEQAEEGELNGEERQNFGEIQQKVEAMRRQFTSKGGPVTVSGAAPGRQDDQPLTEPSDEGEHAPTAEAETSFETSRQPWSDGQEPPRPADEAEPSAETEAPADEQPNETPPAEVVLVGPAEPDRQGEQGLESAPGVQVNEDIGAGGEGSSPAAESGPRHYQTWQIGQAGEESSAADEVAGTDDQTGQAQTQDSEPLAEESGMEESTREEEEETTAEETSDQTSDGDPDQTSDGDTDQTSDGDPDQTSDGDEDYPALRAMLEKMTSGDGDEEKGNGGKESGWRRFFKTTAGVD